MKRLISRFYDRSLRFLMYRDWSSFESFAVEILKCDSIPGLIQITHRFDTYLKTLLREINKRGVLQARGELAPEGSEPMPDEPEVVEEPEKPEETELRPPYLTGGSEAFFSMVSGSPMLDFMAATISGSNWVPAWASISRNAMSKGRGDL
jgi:hypothetical protein